MTEDSKNKRGSTTQDIDLGLNGLFGALGDAIGEMISRLEEGNSGAVTRDHVFDTDKGPVRAHAGVRLQIGGLEIGGSRKNPTPEVFNPSREKSKPTEKNVRSLEYDLFEESKGWVFTADVPGVARKNLQLTKDGTRLKLETSGTRMFSAAMDLGKPFDLKGVVTHLNNGVLTLNIPKIGDVE